MRMCAYIVAVLSAAIAGTEIGKPTCIFWYDAPIMSDAHTCSQGCLVTTVGVLSLQMMGLGETGKAGIEDVTKSIRASKGPRLI